MSVVSAPNVILTANVRTVTGYTAGGVLHWDMSEFFQGAYCSESSGNTCAPVRYLAGLPEIGEADGLRALTAAIRTTPPPTIVMGFSQGALISSQWLRDNAGESSAPSPEELSFVLVGNPLRKYGGVRPAYDLGEPTPDTEYDVLDIAIEYDGAADFPDNPFNLLALANAFAGFQYVHIYRYDDIGLDTAEKLVWQDGNTTYVLIRNQNVPLLEPLRILGLHDLADTLNDPLKAIIDSAYDRDYPGMVDPASHDDVLQQFFTQDDPGDDADTPIYASLTAERAGQSDGSTDADHQAPDPESVVESDTPAVEDPPAEIDPDAHETGTDSDPDSADEETSPETTDEDQDQDQDQDHDETADDASETDEASEAEGSRDDAQTSADRDSTDSSGDTSDVGGSGSDSDSSAE